MTKHNQPSFDVLVEEALEAPFSGWDFSFIEGRRTRESAPWDYRHYARARLTQADLALDLGTGGGELLSSLAPLPRLTVAAEPYPPNVSVSAARLKPLGAVVVQVDGATQSVIGPTDANPRRRLPFGDDTFDLVMSRSTAFSPLDAFRILRPGGWLLTHNGLPGKRKGEDLAELLGGAGPDWGHWDFLEPAQDAGFRIHTYQEAELSTTYTDIGAIVYYLKNIPWIITDFHIDRYRDKLLALHERIETDGSLITGPGRECLLEAQKP